MIAALAAFGWLYLWLAGILIATTNQNPVAQDQKNNMRQALYHRTTLRPDFSHGVTDALTRWLPHLTDGVVGPLWPWVAAHFARADHVIEEETFQTNTVADLHFFLRGKWVNVGVCGIFLAGLVFSCGRRFSVLGTVNLMLLAGLGALLPRAVYFQPEPIYFCLFFMCWALALRMLEQNPLRFYAMLGLGCGLAFLAKTSIQPLIAAWFAAMGLRFLGCALPGRWKAANDKWHPRHHVIGTLLFAVIFLLTVGPRLAFAHDRWGRPFFAYPNVWMWMDDFKTCFAWMQAHPDKASLDAVSADQWPSFANYRRTHTPEEMSQRLRDGTHEKVTGFLFPKRAGNDGGTEENPWKHLLEWRGAFLGGTALIFLSVCAATLGRTKKVAPPLIAPWIKKPGVEMPPAVDWATPTGQTAFVMGVVAASVLAYGWYTPIGRGDRFMLSLYLPLVFTFIWAAEKRLHRYDRQHRALALRWTYAGLHAVLLSALLWRISEIVSRPCFDPAVR